MPSSSAPPAAADSAAAPAVAVGAAACVTLGAAAALCVVTSTGAVAAVVPSGSMPSSCGVDSNVRAFLLTTCTCWEDGKYGEITPGD